MSANRRLAAALLGACLGALPLATAAAAAPADGVRGAVREPGHVVADGAGPAEVTRCTPPELNDRRGVVQAADAVDTVFTGQVTAVKRTRQVGGGQGKAFDPAPGVGGSTKPSASATRAGTQTIWVQTIKPGPTFRGTEITARSVKLSLTGSDGPRRLRRGSTYLFFADAEHGTYTASACAGVVLLPHGLSAGLERQLHRFLAQPEPTPPSAQLSEPSGGTSSAPSLGRVVAPGVAIGLIGLLGLLLVSRLSRERRA